MIIISRLVARLLGQLKPHEDLSLRPRPADSSGPLALGEGVRLRVQMEMRIRIRIRGQRSVQHAVRFASASAVSSQAGLTASHGTCCKNNTQSSANHTSIEFNDGPRTVSVIQPWKANLPPAAPSGPSSGNSVSTCGGDNIEEEKVKRNE